MKLQISRNQAKGMLGNVKFEVNARVELTDGEKDLIDKYKVRTEPLIVKGYTSNPFLLGKKSAYGVTIKNLVDGHNYKCGSINEILDYEQMIKDSCNSFKNYIEIMKSFGGEEVIEY